MEPPLSVCQRLLKGVPTTRYNDGNRIRCIPKQQDKQENTPAWRVLSASQRESLSRRGFTIVDDIAPLDLVAEAYDEALARASAGSLTPAHGGAVGGGTESEGNDSADGEQGVTGYVKSVRDDLTAFVSVEGESAAGGSGTSGPVEEGQHEVLADGGKGEGVNPAGTGAIGQTLGLLAGLGEDIERMVRLKGRVEHQVGCSFAQGCSFCCRCLISQPIFMGTAPVGMSTHLSGWRDFFFGGVRLCSPCVRGVHSSRYKSRVAAVNFNVRDILDASTADLPCLVG